MNLICKLHSEIKFETVSSNQDRPRATLQPLRRTLKTVMRIMWHAKHVHQPMVRLQSVQSSTTHHGGQHESERFVQCSRSSTSGCRFGQQRRSDQSSWHQSGAILRRLLGLLEEVLVVQVSECETRTPQSAQKSAAQMLGERLRQRIQAEAAARQTLRHRAWLFRQAADARGPGQPEAAAHTQSHCFLFVYNADDSGGTSRLHRHH